MQNRIAYFTPLSPIKSGISAYSEDLLPYLARYFEIDIYIENYSPDNPLIKNNFKIRNYQEFDDFSNDYDLVIYNMGNYTPFHEYIYTCLGKHPGLVVLHDYIYFSFFIGLTLAKGDCRGFRDIMQYCYGVDGLNEADKVLSGSDDYFRYSMIKRIADFSIGVVVHSGYCMQQILQEVPAVNIKKIPMGIEVTNPSRSSKRELCKKYGFNDNEFLFASFGMMSPHKRIDVVLKTFARCKQQCPGVKYLLVGELPQNSVINDLINELDLQSDVVQVGFVDDNSFQDYLSITDVCITLRYPSAGETSSALLRAMEAGKTVIISNYAQFSEYPDDSVVKVDIGPHEEALLLEYMKLLYFDHDLRKCIGENARKYIHDKHSMERTAQAYKEVISECVVKSDPREKIFEDAKSILIDMAGSKQRDYIIGEINNLRADFGMGHHHAEIINDREFSVVNRKVHPAQNNNHLNFCGKPDKKLFKRLDLQPSGLTISKKDLHKVPDGFKCSEIFEEACILADGRVVCSCVDSIAQHVLGDINNCNIYDIFNNIHFQRIRHALMSNKSPGLCLECPLRNNNFNSTDSLIMPHIKALQIEVINACNLKCPECIMSYTTREGANGSYMSFETFKDVIDQLVGPLEVIKFYNYGEPFLHKESIRMLEYIKMIDPKISIYISTNGTCISEDKQRSLVDLEVDLLNFSIDGSCQNSYGQYRIGGQLDQVLRNMSGIIQYRNKNKKIKPFVTWQYILFEWNDSEETINRAKEMAVELGVDSLLWVLTNTNGASKHYIPGSDNLLELISKKGFEWSPTKFVLSTANNRKIYYQYEDSSGKITGVDLNDMIDSDIEDI